MNEILDSEGESPILARLLSEYMFKVKVVFRENKGGQTMKILFLDFIFPKEHEMFNKNMINCLCEIAEVYVLTQENYYENSVEEIPKAKIIEQSDLKIKRGRLSFRLSSLKTISKAIKWIRKLKPDYIFVTCFETISFSLAGILFKKLDNVYLVHHNNTDELKNKFKRKIFNTYMNKVNHIVFEDFIKEYLVKNIGVQSNKVYIVPHPLSESKNLGEVKKKSKSQFINCLGISNSNDESFIKKIIEMEVDKEYLKKNNMKVILRSKTQEFDNGHLKVISGYLEKNIYDEYINSCECIFIPLSYNFCNRISGTLVDALSNHKIVIGRNVELIRRYSEKYPSICRSISCLNDFYNHLNLIANKKENYYHEFLEYRNRHSKDNIVKILGEIFAESRT